MTETDTQMLAAELRELRADFSRIADTLGELLRQRGGAALNGAGDAAQKFYEAARQHTNGIAREIEEKPVTVALGAFGIGVLLGALFAARRG